MRFRFFNLLLFFLLVPYTGHAQFYDTGQDPASLRWLQIKTGKFKIIYPQKYGAAAFDFAASLDRSYSKLLTIYPEKRFRIPVVIHNFTTESNGYVAWAPKRMEIYPTPEQNSIPIDPLEQLTLHELAHVFQMVSLNQGLTKALSLFTGEQLPGLVSSLLPGWYLEGEAVLTESLFSASGRGRSAAFQKEIKAISVEKGKMYKYDKMVNGSFRNFVPDIYRSGYQTVAWTYANYDPGIWNKVLKFTANLPFSVDPVNISLLSNTGHTKRRLFNETFDTLTKIWTNETDINRARSYEIINPSKGKNYINYYSPVKVGERSYVAIKKSLSFPAEFVLLNLSDKTEKRIHVPGNIYPYALTAARRMLVWVETQTDPRWENRNYSVIKLLDIRNKSIRQLSWKTRYMSASVSPDGKTVAATENTIDNKNNLVFIDVNTGDVTQSFAVPGNAYLQKPQWSDDGTKITVISLSDRGEGIRSFRLNDLSWETIIPERAVDLQSSYLRHDSLFFVSSASGTENIYTLTPGKEIRKLTNSKFGATDIIPDGDKILFCDYSSSGNNISIMDINVDSERRETAASSSFFLIGKIDSIIKPSNSIAEKEYNPTRYRKWQHLFRFHSWMPFYADLEQVKADPTSISPGFTVFSQNQLSTVISSLGYEYSNGTHKLHSQLTLKGWYPVFESRFDFGDQQIPYKLGNNVADPLKVVPGIFFTNSISVPLGFSNGKYSQFIRPSISAVYQNQYIYVKEESDYDYGQTQFSARFYFSNYHKYTSRDIYPRWAQIVDLSFSAYPFDRKFYGSSITLNTALYFPGIFRNNSIRIRYENEIQKFEELLTGNRINYPRGYNNIISEELNFLSFDYSAPLFYPDLNIRSLIYLKRIRAGLFFDYGSGTNNYYLVYKNGGLEIDQHNNYQESFSSFGFELISDFHVLRLPYMVSAGVQAAWIEAAKIPALKLILNIDIFGMKIGKRQMKDND